MVTFNFPIRLGHTDRGVPHRRERGIYWLLIGQGSHLRASDCSVGDTNLLPSCCYPRHSDYSLWSYCKLMDTWLKQNLVRSDESHHTQSFLKLESGGWCPRTGARTVVDCYRSFLLCWPKYILWLRIPKKMKQ